VVSDFSLSPAALASVAGAVRATAANAATPLDLWDASRQRARRDLGELAQRIEPRACWAELVLPARQKTLLSDIVAQVRNRWRVYDRWGFAQKSSRGLGLSALFAGQSGTGKTMAAEVIANTLGLDLHQIDLSSVVSKYIGETEKNLRRLFDAAEGSGAILFFDEADALFGKRSEVKDSHDRYANIEVSYLLQRMEAYRGLAILATNMKSALDHAFLRRIRFLVDFPFPDAEDRAAIWRRVFPEATPSSGLDYERLARLHVPGGNIRSIALNAAFRAADEGAPVQMRHLLHAAQVEYVKLERPLADTEVAGWV
jgi:SpoVK/Ycf46/Vps4 family AAA+-type ATPase